MPEDSRKRALFRGRARKATKPVIGLRNRDMPNLFVIGAAKCGTTSLHRYLDLHPAISMSKVKEPSFFARHDPTLSKLAIVSRRPDYLRLFQAGTRYRGESSTTYSQAPIVEGIPGAIVKEAPDAKLIFLVCDPIRRIQSHCTQILARRGGEFAFVSEGASITDLFGDPADPGNRLLGPSRYWLQLERYLRCFPPESILVLDSDELRIDRRGAMGKIFEFLGVDSSHWSDRMLVELNQSRDLKRTRDVYVRMSSLQLLRAVLPLLPMTTRIRLFIRLRALVSRPWSPPVLDRETRLKFEEVLRPEVDALRDFTGQEFPSWNL